MIHKVLPVALALALSSDSSLLGKQEPAPEFKPTLPWMSELDEALAAAKKSGKPILVEFR